MNQSRLNHLESIGTTSGEDIVQAMNVLLPLAVDRSPAPVVFYRGGRGDGTAQGLPVNASFYVVRFSSGRRCLELEDARNGVYQIRRVIRAHLGLPAPAVAPTVFEIPAAGAPTSLGAPAPAQAR